jgi:uncharacterized membrane protein YraQ (UPF0718 family)
MYALSRRVRFLLHALDGFVLTAVGSLVLLHIAPRAVTLGGLWSVAAAALGLALPALFERMVFGRRARGWAIVLGLIGLVSHTLIDGAAIGSEKEAGALSWAIVVHRLPAGILVWWLVRPAFGLRRASLMLGGLILATVAGFALGTRFDFVEERSLAIFEAFVAGALLHVLLSHGPELHGETGPHNRVAELLGAALGVLTIVLIPESSGHDHSMHSLGGAGSDLLHLSQAIALPLIVGLAIASFLAARMRAFGAGAAVRRFRETGNLLELAAVPQLVPPAILLSLALLGPLLTAARFGAALIAAWTVAFVVRRAIGKRDGGGGAHPDKRAGNPKVDLHPAEPESVWFGFVELMDESAAWILLGIAANLLLRGVHFDPAALLSVPIAALIGLLPFVCATGATPLASAAMIAGVPFGAVLAFMVAGSMVNPTSLSAIRARFDRRAAILFALSTFVMAVVLGIVADLLLPPLTPPSLSLDLDSSIDRASSIFLLTLIAAALVRLGPRGFIQTLLRPTDSSAPDPHPHHHHHA